ncbi:putative protein phosphatase 2C 55 [Gossypium australe]|uniref:Protein phosphatase n=1 Tax=Gossypium australe TaxID=47621 RepID=A0A5B6VMR6_9ROSI|nr:putative protein phosphatase 2C 55 [Gossypium australe]
MKVLDEAFFKTKAQGRAMCVVVFALILLHTYMNHMLHAVNVGDSRFMVIRREAGDVIIAGTDGLFDNLFELQILATASKGIEQDLGAEEMAWEMVQLAYQTSRDKAAVTPIMEASEGLEGFVMVEKEMI